MVVAPAAFTVAGLKVTVATPVVSVSAVAAGVIVAKVESVLNVTTAPAIAVPFVYFKVAFTVAGVPLVIEVVGAPPFVSVMDRLGTLLPGVLPGASGVPAPQPDSITVVTNGNRRKIESP